MALNDIIQTNVITITQDSSVMNAAKLMYEKHVGCLIVVDQINHMEKRPVGIITDRDIVIYWGKRTQISSDALVSEVMNPNVVLCTPLDGVYDTISKMKNNGIRRIPVVDAKDRLVGIITADDLLQLISKEIHDLSEIISNESAKEMNLIREIAKNEQLQTFSTPPQ